jgi:16S rRNA (cytidine1402-2'-O)-methyltransferase
MSGVIYVLPSEISDINPDNFFPSSYKDFLLDIRFYAVENVRTARRFLKKVQSQIRIDESTFFLLDKDTKREDALEYIKPVLEGNHLVIMSEAGAPGIADPGNILVAIAHEQNISVRPLVGPSSIFMALMSSGMNGQNFAFSGYLPIKNPERALKIKDLSKRALIENQSQIFMETPFRNEQLLQDLIANADSRLKLCIAMNITGENEYIKVRKIKNWAQDKPSLHKIPCIFILSQ